MKDESYPGEADEAARDEASCHRTTHAVYLGDSEVSTEQVNWGSNDDPRGILIEGETYEVLRSEMHTWHTKMILKAFPEKKFNSVHFRFP